MILLKKLKSIYKLLLISILATFTVASSANSIELKGYYGSISANLFDGEAFQDKGDLGNWAGYYPTNPQWDYEETSVGINFGKYFNSSANSRNALEINYISEIDVSDRVTGRTLGVFYKDIMSVDLLYLRKLNDKIEFFGSVGLGVMELGGSQNSDGVDKFSTSEHVQFKTFGGGFLYKANEMFDIKLSVKKYMDQETDILAMPPNYTSREFGYEDLYVTTAAIVYNF